MKKKDWIILRLIRVAVNDNPQVGRRSIDVAKSIVYLGSKYGREHMYECLKQLHKEKANDQ